MSRRWRPISGGWLRGPAFCHGRKLGVGLKLALHSGSPAEFGLGARVALDHAALVFCAIDANSVAVRDFSVRAEHGHNIVVVQSLERHRNQSALFMAPCDDRPSEKMQRFAIGRVPRGVLKKS